VAKKKDPQPTHRPRELGLYSGNRLIFSV